VKMFKINNWSLSTKMLLPAAILVIALVVLSVLAIRNIDKMGDKLITSLYTEAYQINYLVLNADRDYYQAKIAEFMLTTLQNPNEIKVQQDDYNENVKQTYDRVQQAKVIMENNRAVFEKYKDPETKKDVFQLIEDFDTNYNAWKGQFNYEERRYVNSTESGVKFAASRQNLDQIENIMDQYSKDAIDESAALSGQMRLVTIIELVAILVIASLLIFFIVRNVRNRTKDTLTMIHKTANFDLVYDDSFTRYLSEKDEFAVIIQALGEARKEFRTTFSRVIQESRNLQDTIQIVDEEMNKLEGGVQDISATTEQLSAGMEETAASTQEMNATSTEIESAVNSVASKAQEGARAAEGLTVRAADLSKQFKHSYSTSTATYNQVRDSLVQALEESKSVQQINSLVSSIIDIASQTNLLSLNASIEAARAGDAGRGFAVVASEISKLAEDSKKAADQINEITQVVVGSVSNLSSNSNDLLNLFSTNVRTDYEMMLSSADQYASSAQEIDDIANDLSATSEELLASIENVVKAIQEISVAANEGAEGTSMIAEKTDDIVQQTSRVAEQMKQSKQGINELAESVAKFKL